MGRLKLKRWQPSGWKINPPVNFWIGVDNKGSDQPVVWLYTGNKRRPSAIGSVWLFAITPTWLIPSAMQDYRALRKALDVRSLPLYRLGMSNLEPEYHHQGLGIMLYEAALSGLGEDQPIAIVADVATKGGTTSEMALRVWKSLKRRWVGRGLIVSSVRK